MPPPQGLAGTQIRQQAVDDLRITDILPATGDDYRSHGPGHIRLSAGFHVRAKVRCRELRPAAVIQVHSHPFANGGSFSRVGDADFPEVAYDFVNASPGVRCGRWVWGRKLRRSRLELAAPGARALAALRSASIRLIPRTVMLADPELTPARACS